MNVAKKEGKGKGKRKMPDGDSWAKSTPSGKYSYFPFTQIIAQKMNFGFLSILQTANQLKLYRLVNGLQDETGINFCAVRRYYR